ncbi:hypothetical protein [Chitinophaga arvensicola]|uniref:Uncharacterized protein n=1 Tax=Chitinophaga arvensicola TaxID=29529 RepID=A0A1I0RDF7_9BACT|nr:hypothetical protein [Chitinophaga arvensicola]SEW38848.1 hypothetical protein SAMN04488122_2667 [Chitinophaga arvensicola]
MNLIQLSARFIIRQSFHLSVKIIESCSDTSTCREQLQALKQLPPGTLGHDIASCLEQHRLRLVPGFESHDLKHVLLGFKMTPEDEIRLQAFMIGNGNYTMASFAIFIYGALLLPDRWSTFYSDWCKGRETVPVSTWTLESHAYCDTVAIQQYIAHPVPQIPFMNRFVKFGAMAAIVAGVSGMLFCLPFLFSASVADLVGAGFPFVGGAVIASAGLIALSNVTGIKAKEVLAV